MIEELSYHIIFCFISAFYLFIWFDTESVIEYVKLLRLNKFFFIKEYEESKETIDDLTYPQYLEIYQKDFFNKILSCVYCSCTWVVIYVNFFLVLKFGISTFKFFGIDWFFSLGIYFTFTRFFNK
jgi:hypothetical protein